MKSHYAAPIFPILLVLMFSFVLNFAKAQTPIVTSIYPTSGNLGDTINIYGSNFSANPNDNIVYFGTNHAKVLSASSNILSVIVPASANKAPIKVYTPNTISNTTYFPSPNTNIYFTQTYSPNKQGAQDFDFDAPIRVSNCPKDTNFIEDNFVGDLDGDALPDYVTWSSDSIFVYINSSSNGNISLSNSLKIAMSTIKDVAFGDFDTDGKIDFVVSFLNGAIYIYKNVSSVGNISFNYANTISSSTAPTNNSFILSVGDLNNDAKPDIAAYTSLSATSKTVNVFINNSFSATINFSVGSIFTVNSTYKRMNICDIDNDGQNDIVAFGDTISTGFFLKVSEIYILRNNLNAGILLFLPEYKMKQSFYGNIKIADLDGDNKLDFISLGYSLALNYSLITMKNACSSAAINFITTINPSTFYVVPQLGIGDVNGDGKLDVIVKNYNYDFFNDSKSQIFFYINQSNSNGITFKTQRGINSFLLGNDYSNYYVNYFYFNKDTYIYFHPNSITLCDLNSDGKGDIVNTDNFELYVFKNNSTYSNANLSSLYLEQGKRINKFNKNTLVYYDSVSANISSIKLTLTTEDLLSKMQVRINGGTYNTILYDSTVTIPLNLGNNAIEILVTAPDSVTTKNYTLIITKTTLKTQLKIKAFIEGLFAGSQQMISSITAFNYFNIYNFYDYKLLDNVADTILIELYSSAYPHPKVSSQKAILDIYGNASVFFNSGGNYYVVIKHRNSIETWSAVPVNFPATSPIIYDFTASASKAFGENLLDDGSGNFLIYSGDINQDGSVDFNDYPEIDLASSIGFIGYNNCDLNGDASIDFNDYPMLDVNSSNGVMVRSPQ